MMIGKMIEVIVIIEIVRFEVPEHRVYRRAVVQVRGFVALPFDHVAPVMAVSAFSGRPDEPVTLAQVAPGFVYSCKTPVSRFCAC